ncbi:MAG: ABC transporter permease [Desulfobulbaceae bacterium]|nr:ABC transporter permease [Desulfobulbaceae bacterium]
MSDIIQNKQSLESDFWLNFRRSRNAQIGSAIVFLVLSIALFGPFLAPYEYTSTDMFATWEPPGGEHLLGTDGLGRDILSRMLVGARVSLTVAMVVLGITLTVGTILGMLAGYIGGWVDNLIMRFVDIIFAFPELILAILVASILGAGTATVIVALALVYWPGIARMTRALVISLKSELFVEAAVACGTPTYKILFKHLLPNIIAPLIVRMSVGVGFLIMAEATLSFLGIGIQEPEPTWGGMIRDGLFELRTDPYLALFNSAILGITIIGFNLLGDGLRDILDPKVRDK